MTEFDISNEIFFGDNMTVVLAQNKSDGKHQLDSVVNICLYESNTQSLNRGLVVNTFKAQECVEIEGKR